MHRIRLFELFPSLRRSLLMPSLQSRLAPMAGDSCSTSLSSSSPSYSLQSSADSSSCSSPSLPSLAPDVSSVVPFLWEEKPGVSKLDMQHIGQTQAPCSPSSGRAATPQSTFVPSRADPSPPDFPPLRPPPRLQQSPRADPLPSERGRKLKGGLATRGLSHSFRMGRHEKRSKPDEDPFLLALKVCTKEERAGLDGLHTGIKDFAGRFKKKEQPASVGDQPGCKSIQTKRLQSSFVAGCDLHSALNHDVVPGMKDGHPTRESVRSKGGFPATPKKAYEARAKWVPRADKVPHSRRAEMACGHRIKIKSLSRQQMLPDLFGCKSIQPLHSSVIDPSLYVSRRRHPSS